MTDTGYIKQDHSDASCSDASLKHNFLLNLLLPVFQCITDTLNSWYLSTDETQASH